MRLSDEEVASLSPQERLTLIEQLWDSLDDAAIPLSGEQQAELERRLANFDLDRDRSVTWQQLRAELQQRQR